MNEWGLPDWRDELSYGTTDSWHLWRWRWEFYRRREDLRRDYDKHANDPVNDPVAKRTFRRQPTAGVEAEPKPGDKDFLVFVSWAASRYGYGHLPNPRFGDHPIKTLFPYADHDEDVIWHPAVLGLDSISMKEIIDDNSAVFEFCDDGEYNIFVKRRLDGRMMLAFNLDKPLVAQLEFAKRILKEEQIKIHGKQLKKARHPAKWLLYLRVLDATEYGASLSEIASILPDHMSKKSPEQEARNVRKQAEELQLSF